MSPFKYAKVGNESSNEESLPQQHAHPGPGRLATWYIAVEKFQFLRWPVTFFLLFVILICELSILHKQPSSLHIGDELNAIVPRFSTEQKIFYSDDRYASDHTTLESINKTKHQWRDLIPRGGGFLEVPDYSSYTLPSPMHFPQKPGKEIYAIAVFHQMHCLHHVAAYIDKLVMQIQENKNLTIETGDLEHSDHCFNYLRNVLLCCGDTTLEGQSQDPKFKDVPSTDGTGAVHMCRNYDELTSWAEGRRLTEARWGLNQDKDVLQ